MVVTVVSHTIVGTITLPKLTATLIKTGPEALIRPIVDALGIRKIVDRLCPMDRPNGITHGQVIEALVYNRLLDPSPLCHVADWFENAGMAQVLGFSADKVNDDRLARALDAVAYANEDIHTAATLQAVSAFDLDTRLVHHDTTSFYFTGDYDEQEWITYGYSRDKRPDTKQMNLALTINGDGVPLDHTVLPGNENDVTGMKARMDALKNRLPEGSRLVVTDRGMVSADNLRSLRAQGFDFIASLKLTEPQKDVIRAVPLDQFQPVEDQPFHVHEDQWLVGTVPCRVVVIYSEDKAKRDAARRQRQLNEIRQGLSVIHAGLNKGRLKDRDAVRDKIRDLLKGANMMPYFDFKVELVAGSLTMRVMERADLLAKDEQMDGIYALVTNLTEPDGPEILRQYKSRAKIEQRIKDMKSHLRLRPIFVHTEERIHGLVLVNVLALLVYSLLEVALRRMGRDETARKILRHFQGATFAHATGPDGSVLVFEVVPPKPEESQLLAGIAAAVKANKAA